MYKKENNYAFIDGQNLYQGIKTLGWILDWKKFRVYLKDKYTATKALIFIGYIEKNKDLYFKLKKAGFILIFKPTIFDSQGKVKGNCDADLVLYSVKYKKKYDKAIIVTSDGDFYSLIRYLYSEDKLKIVLSPHIQTCSVLLKKEAKDKIFFLERVKNKISK